jgi:hypothetical protein
MWEEYREAWEVLEGTSGGNVRHSRSKKTHYISPKSGEIEWGTSFVCPLGPTPEQEDLQSLVCAGLRRFGSGWRCASWRGTASRDTSGRDLRASRGGRRLRTRIPSSLVAGASAGIRCPSHNRGSVPSLLTFFLILLRSRPARRLKLDDRRSDEGPAGRDRQTPKSATEHAWGGNSLTLEQSWRLRNGPKVRESSPIVAISSYATATLEEWLALAGFMVIIWHAHGFD